ARHLAQSRVGLLGRGGVDARAYSAPLRASLQRRAGGLVIGGAPPLADKLIERRHLCSSRTTPGRPLGPSCALTLSPNLGESTPETGAQTRLKRTRSQKSARKRLRTSPYSERRKSAKASGPAPGRTAHRDS